MDVVANLKGILNFMKFIGCFTESDEVFEGKG